MSNNSTNPLCGRAALLTLAASLVLSPTAAFAEEEASGGITLLVPALAELIPATIAFAIVFIIMSKLAWPAIVKMMEDRENKIQGDLDAAESARIEAEGIAAKSAERIAAAEQEAAEIISAAKQSAEQERARILEKAQAEAAATIEKARDVVESERKKSMLQLSQSVVDLSVSIAGKILGNDLDDTAHRTLAERYLAEVGNSDDVIA